MENNQSISISGGQLSGVQIGGLAGHDLTVTQSQQSIAPSEIVDLLDQLKALVQETKLSDADKAKAIRNIETAQDEAQAEEPDKEFAAKSLQKATKVLKDASDTVDAGTNLWEKVTPILEKISPWLKVATGFFLL